MLVTVVVPVKDEKFRFEKETKSSAYNHSYTWLVVDDGSKEPHPDSFVRHSESIGYGASLKHGISLSETDWIVTMDGDGQHELEDVLRLLDFVERFPEVDMVIGDRRVKETSLSRYFGRKFLNITASLFAWRWIPDLNSGLRIFRKKTALGYFPILCDGFSFTTSLTLSMLADGYKVDWLPIRVKPRAHGLSKVNKWKDGWVTLKYILWIGCALRTRWIRSVLRNMKQFIFCYFFILPILICAGFLAWITGKFDEPMDK